MNIGLWFYAISLIVSTVFILFWENNYRKLCTLPCQCKLTDVKGAWNLNPFDRGKSLEATLKGWGTNFPVIDMYDDATKTITSIKSLDLNAKSYKSGNAVYNRVKGYIDDLSNFKGKDYGGRSVPENGIQSRVLKLAIPEGATQSQQDQLKRLIDYAQQNNVQLNIVLAK